MSSPLVRNFAVIPTANRPEVCLQAIESIRDQVDLIYIIDNGTSKRLGDLENADLSKCFPVWRNLNIDGVPNLSKIWNIGLDLAEQVVLSTDLDRWNVAIINDDAIVPPGWMEAVSTRMRFLGGVAACSGSLTGWEILQLHPGPVPLQARMQGWAFVLAGERGLRFDEELKWWFGDDDMDWRSRGAGGMVMIRDYPVINQFPNGQMTPELQEQANRDRETFKAKWGQTPW